MGKIKFRGKRVNDGEWVYGWYYESVNYFDGSTKPMIIWINQIPSSIDRMIPAFEMIEWEVVLETVGQYTGRKDDNGKEIYDGDICESLDGMFLVAWNEEKSAFVMVFQDYPYEMLYLEEMWDNTKIIGNINDNFDLLN